MRRDVAEEFRGGSERGEASEDEAIDECFQPLQAVLQRQRLQVQVVVLTHLLLQELATKIHDSPDLPESLLFKSTSSKLRRNLSLFR